MRSVGYVLLAGIIAVGCSQETPASRIARGDGTGVVDALTSDLAASTAATPPILAATRAVMEKGDEPLQRRTEAVLFDGQTSIEQRRAAAEIYQEFQRRFLDGERGCNVVLSLLEDDPGRKAAAATLERTTPGSVARCLTSRCLTAIESGNTTDALKFAEGLMRVVPEKTGAATAVAAAIRAGSDAYTESEALEAEVTRLEGGLVEARSKLLTDNIATLHAFMVAEQSPHFYEIALADYVGWGTPIPSARHAILMTTETTFTSKGWFRISAQRVTEVPIKLKEEFGSFTQAWPVYSEVTSSQIADRDAAAALVKQLQEEQRDKARSLDAARGRMERSLSEAARLARALALPTAASDAPVVPTPALARDRPTTMVSVHTMPSASNAAAPSVAPSWIKVPAGTFIMGCSAPDTGCFLKEEPRRVVALEEFSLMKSEVTVDDYRRCVDDGKCSPAGTGDECNAGSSERGRHPINCISHAQAGEVCRALDGRLPTAEEWEYAAKSGREVTFPWGDTPPTSEVANFCDARCPAVLTPQHDERMAKDNGVSIDQARGMRVTSTVDDGFGGTSPVDAYLAGANAWGFLGMAGNVNEWTSTPWGQAMEQRGGSCIDRPKALRASNRFPQKPTAQLFQSGVRCAR